MSASQEWSEARVVVANRLGFHARSALMFAQAAAEFQSEVRVGTDQMEVNGRDILQLLALAIQTGTEIVIRANGPDAAQAVDALQRLVVDKFGEGE